jgi:hypothetical protein
MLPALWLITSVCLILIINKIKVKNIRTIVHITIILLIAGTMVSNNGLYAYLNREYPFYFAKNRVLSIGDNIVNKTINCRTVRIMGTFCELSPGLLSWLFYSGQKDTKVKIYYEQPKGRFNLIEQKREIGTIDEDSVVFIELDKSSPYYNVDYKLYNEWKMKDTAIINNLPGYCKSFEQYYLDQGIIVKIYNRV